MNFVVCLNPKMYGKTNAVLKVASDLDSKKLLG